MIKYNYFRVAGVTPDLRIGDIDYNCNMHVQAVKTALEQGAELVLFPELSISGYSCADMFYSSKLINKTYAAIERLANENFPGLVIVGAPIASEGKIYNTAVVIFKNRILGVIPKSYLCSSGEYYEGRWFASDFQRNSDTVSFNNFNDIPFGSDLIFECKSYPDLKVGVEICEDLWGVKPVSNDLVLNGATLICNLSASNEYIGKMQIRKEVVASQSRRLICAYAYSAAGPAESTSDTVFSGHSLLAENGNIMTETARFEFGTNICYCDYDIELLQNERRRNSTFTGTVPTTFARVLPFDLSEKNIDLLYRNIPANPYLPFCPAEKNKYLEDIINIQTTGLSGRLRSIHCSKAIIGVSGGLDSTLALLVTVEAFKKLKLDLSGITAVTMPGFGTTGRTRNNAEVLAELLKVDFKTISIEKAVRQHFSDIGQDENNYDITYENSQARERTQILMDLSNKLGGIVIGTGDMSEIALGWCTYNGDQMSMYNVNAGVPKTMIQELIKYISENKFSPEIADVLKDICNTPISPELLPPDKAGNIEQKTESEIGPYELHDFFLFHHLKSNFEPEKIAYICAIAFHGKYSEVEIKKWLNTFYRRFFTQQFKRNPMPDGPKVCQISLSPRGELRLPSEFSPNIWLQD